MQYIAFDAHKRYTLAVVERQDRCDRVVREQRIPHERGALRRFLEGCEPGSPVAVEALGNWYWIVDEIEAAGCEPKLVHARKAKLMLGMLNKTDRLDARGLNRLQRAGTLPTVWIPPGALRDHRDLPRTRMVLVRHPDRLHRPSARGDRRCVGHAPATRRVPGSRAGLDPDGDMPPAGLRRSRLLASRGGPD